MQNTPGSGYGPGGKKVALAHLAGTLSQNSKIEEKLEYPAKALPSESFVRSLFYEFHRTSVEFEWPLSVPFRGFSWVPFRGFSWVFVGFRGFSWDFVGFHGMSWVFVEILPVSFVGFPGLSKVPF